MGNQNKYLTKNKTFYTWPPLKNKLSKALSTKSGKLMTSIRVEPSTKKRPRSSFKTLSETSDPVMNSLMKLSMRYSAHSIRTTPVPSRKVRWLFSSSNSLVDNEQPHPQLIVL